MPPTGLCPFPGRPWRLRRDFPGAVRPELECQYALRCVLFNSSRVVERVSEGVGKINRLGSLSRRWAHVFLLSRSASTLKLGDRGVGLGFRVWLSTSTCSHGPWWTPRRKTGPRPCVITCDYGDGSGPLGGTDQPRRHRHGGRVHNTKAR